MQPPDDEPWRQDPPPRRRWPVVLIVVVVLLSAAGAGVAAWRNFEAGSGWRERALALEERAVAAESRIEDLEAEHTRLRSLLERSEEDVALLESRLAALASEKAGAEDSAALAAGLAEDLSAVTLFAAEVGSDLRDCITRQASLTNDIIADVNGGNVDPASFNQRIAAVNAACSDAERAYGDLRSRLSALGR